MVIVCASGYPVMDNTLDGVFYWPSAVAAQKWIDRQPERTAVQRKAKAKMYVQPLTKAPA